MHTKRAILSMLLSVGEIPMGLYTGGWITIDDTVLCHSVTAGIN